MSKLMKLNKKIERLENELEYLRNKREQHYRVDPYGDRPIHNHGYHYSRFYSPAYSTIRKPTAATVMYVYLLKLSQALGNENHKARFYLGSTGNLLDRMQQHRIGQGARIIAAAIRRGLTFQVIRIWKFPSSSAARFHERQWKRWKNHRRLLTRKSEYDHPLAGYLAGKEFYRIGAINSL